MAKYFQIPFAMNGDRKEIPTDKQEDGSISFDEGYGADYEKNKQVDPTAKDISRQEFNSVLHDITGAIGEIQRSGVATWTNEISYSKGATIIHNGAVYTSTINENKNEPPHSSWYLIDLTVYRKKDDLLFNGMMQVQATDDAGTGVFLLDKDGNPRGQMTYNSGGLQFAQHDLDGSSKAYTLPDIGGELISDSALVNSWSAFNYRLAPDAGFLKEALGFKTLASLGITESIENQFAELVGILTTEKFLIAPTYPIYVDLSKGNLDFKGCTILGKLSLVSTTSVDASRIIIENSHFERLEVTYTGNASEDRGIVINSNVYIKDLSIKSSTIGRGKGNIRRRGVSIGSENYLTTNVKIDNINIENWVYAVASYNTVALSINGGVVSGHVQGFWVRDTSYSSFSNIHTENISDLVVGQAGENGFILDATNHYGTKFITLNNCEVNGAGEHGYRLGGNKVIEHVYFNNCVARDTGKGIGTGVEPHHHGGCGFKVLGSTAPSSNKESYNSFHSNIHFNNCTVYNVNIKQQSNNFDGFNIGKTIGFSLNGCSVRTNTPAYFGDTTPVPEYSCVNGVAIVGSLHGTISNLYVDKTSQNGIYLFDVTNTSTAYWGVSSEDITISNVCMRNIGDSALFFYAVNSNYRRIHLDNLKLDIAGKLVDANIAQGFRIIHSSLTNFFATPPSLGASPNAALNNVFLTGRVTGSINIPNCALGSIIYSTEGIKTYSASGWV